ncbi:hypothetical protein D3C72_1596260 [compost metagenome]
MAKRPKACWRTASPAYCSYRLPSELATLPSTCGSADSGVAFTSSRKSARFCVPARPSDWLSASKPSWSIGARRAKLPARARVLAGAYTVR